MDVVLVAENLQQANANAAPVAPVIPTMRRNAVPIVYRAPQSRHGLGLPNMVVVCG
jgi:hypothetical protein